MHNTTKFNPVRLIDRAGHTVHTFSSEEQIILLWPYIRRWDIGKYFKKDMELLWWIYPQSESAFHTYILRDSFGSIVSPEHIHNVWWANTKKSKFRNYPTYNTWSKQKSGHWFRRPKTTQERRWNDAWDDVEDAPKGRCKRNSKNLISAWDDYSRSDQYDRNWKKHRKTQWK